MILTMKDKQRANVIAAVMDNKLEVEAAGRILKRSVRQIFRMLRRMRKEGIEGLIHKNRGIKSPFKVKERVRRTIITLATGKYHDVNDTQMKELLLREEGIRIGRETLRTLLRRAGIEAKRSRRKPKYRRRRERKDSLGVMLQIDASAHDWLEGRGPWITLVGAKDDATGYTWCKFVQAETTWSYLELMREVFVSHGLPMSLYSDRHSIFHPLRQPTIMEQLKGIQPLTQFGRAMDELGIGIIKAWSPQAKGRIERLWGVLQDRLVVELRLQKANNLQQANDVLERFLVTYNQRFTFPAIKQGSAFRKAPATDTLDRILCLKDTRVVSADHTISFEGLILQIPPSTKFRSIVKQQVEVLQVRDGSIQILYKGQLVARFSPDAVARLIKTTLTEHTHLRMAV
ncbi:MAG: ISNCY family transposase [Deltaproteobacteria bacterium]|nr:ISNCY family transposase [Deltaproteobacteria bacterium]